MNVMKKGLILREGFALQNRLMVRMKYGIDEKDYGGILPRCQTRRETQSLPGQPDLQQHGSQAFGEVMVSKLFAGTAGRRFSDLFGLRG